MIHTHSLTGHFRSSLLARSLVLVLACATACSQPVSNSQHVASAGTVAAASTERGTERNRDKNKEGGTGTRAKGEEAVQAPAKDAPLAEPLEEEFAAAPPI